MQRCKNAICSRSAILPVWHVQEVPYWLPGHAMLVATTWWVATCLQTGLATLSRDFKKQEKLLSRRQTCRILSQWMMGSWYKGKNHMNNRTNVDWLRLLMLYIKKLSKGWTFSYLHRDGRPCLAEMGFVNIIEVDYIFCLQIKASKPISAPAFITVLIRTREKSGRVRSYLGLRWALRYEEKGSMSYQTSPDKYPGLLEPFL